MIGRERIDFRTRTLGGRILVSTLLTALVLLAPDAWGQADLSRGPYLQLGTANSVVLRWRTDLATDSRVIYGPAPGSLTNSVTDATLGTEHEVALSGLVADTRYFYAVGTTTDILAGDDIDHFFVTSPPIGSAKPTRIWVIGDSGTAHQRQTNPAAGEVRDAQGVRDSYLLFSGTGATLVTYGAPWKYLDDGSDQGTAWRSPAFDDSAWLSGPAELGYGDGDEATVINCGPSSPTCNSNNFTTTYFRHSFDVAESSIFGSLTLTVLRDDGAVVYLNGTEVLRTNMPPGAIDFTTPAPAGVGSVSEHVFHTTSIDPALLVDGNNVLAVEVHQFSPSSSDVSFNLELFGQTPGGVAADVWLMLGDNAYDAGTDDEWQQAVFNPYPTLLRNTVLWPALGNHDVLFLDGVAYRQIMTLPTNAEAGGIASGTEEYYAFDYGNIHFIALDSTHPTSRLPGSAMLTWLENDLAATTQDWIIAFWHHTPYSKGSHDSDTEIELIEMRENVLPILEAGGVDLVLTGHSHSYERSFLIDGFYATPTTIGDGTIIDSGDGCVETACAGPYNKPTLGPTPLEGAVYAVVGISGRNLPALGTLDHPLMFFSANDLGSMILDVDGGRLDATLVNRSCAAMNDPACVLDSFTIVKGEIQPVYLDLSSATTSVSPGGGLPFAVEFQNISGQTQGFWFALILGLPDGQNFPLFATPLALGPLTTVTAEPAIPIPLGAPLGAWSLTGVAVQPSQGMIDNSSIGFVVE